MTSDPDTVRGDQDWRALLRTRANVLVTGSKGALDGFVGACRSELRRPLSIVSAAGPLSLHWSSTLVITDVDRLDTASQRTLAAWIHDPENSDTQIISLTAVPLFPLVDAGRFDRDLFYRLNTIHLELPSN